MIFIVGGRGRLGQALLQQYSPDEVVSLERTEYEHWAADDSLSSIAEYFSQHADENSVVYICSGLLDPRLPARSLHEVNFHLPRNILRATSPLGVRAVTFGTAMESTLTANPYVNSKLQLSQYVEESNRTRQHATHIRIHTLYGSAEPSPFMFLGQILQALRTDTPFEMTQGRQLREYHHVDDDAAAIKSLEDTHIGGIVELSHGLPVTLRKLAEAIFDAFGKSDLLQLGALPEPMQENFGHVFQRPPALDGARFRDSVPAVVEYMKLLIND